MLLKRESDPGLLTKLFARLIPDLAGGRGARLDRDLLRAGYYRPHARLEFLAARNLLVLCGAAIVAIAYYVGYDLGPLVRAQILFGGLFAVGWLYVIPRFYLTAAGSRRVQRILDGLPDALDIVTMCVSSGLPLHASLERVKGRIRDVHPELAAELDIMHKQVALGATDVALRDFANRIDEPDVQALADVVTHAERVGADVGAVISDYSDNIRQGIRQRAEQRGNMMSIKLLFPIMLCLAPAAYLLLLTPAVVELRQFLIREHQPGGALDVSAASQVVRRPITAGNYEAASPAAPAIQNRPAPFGQPAPTVRIGQ